MKNKLSVLIIALITLFFVQCTYYYRLIQKDSDFFSPGEVTMLAETTKIIDFGYGFDPDIDMNYVFIYPQGLQDKQKKEKDLLAFLDKYKKGDLLSFYEKMYTLKVLQNEKMLMYKRRMDWKNYTYIEKYMLPPLNEYMSLLEKGVIQKDRTYMDSFEARKMDITELIKKEIQEEENVLVRKKIRQASNSRKPK